MVFVCVLFRWVLSFYSSLMQVNLKQYRGTVGVFNNSNFPIRKSYDFYSSRLSQQPVSIIFMIAITFVIYIIAAQNIQLVHQSL